MGVLVVTMEGLAETVVKNGERSEEAAVGIPSPMNLIICLWDVNLGRLNGVLMWNVCANNDSS